MNEELDRAVQAAQRVMEILERHAPAAEAAIQDLRQGIRDIEEGNAFLKKQALRRLGEKCHPKALGDIHLQGLSAQEWWKELEHLHDACAQAFNKLERDAP